MRYIIVLLLFTTYCSSAQTYMDTHIAQTVIKYKDDVALSNGQGEDMNSLISVCIIREGNKQNKPSSGLLEFTSEDKSKDILYFTIEEANFDKQIGNELEGTRDDITIKMENEQYSNIKNITFLKLNGEIITIFIKRLALSDILSEWGRRID